MKNPTFNYTTAILILCLLISCNYSPIEYENLTNDILSLDVRSEAKGEISDFEVTKDMAEYYARSFEDRTELVSIEPYEYQGEICFYVVNFEKGWMVITADSRVQPILGESEDDNLYPKELKNPGVRVWMEDCADIIYHVKLFGLKDYDKDSYALWQGIKKQVERNESKYIPETEVAWVRYYHSTTTTQTNANVGHLLQTSWGQGTPWNCSLPIDPAAQNGDTTRFVTGCVPTAVSQILYYFHNKTGYPNDLWHFIEPSISQVLTNGFYKLSLIKSNYTTNSIRWANMPTTSYGSGGFGYVSDLMLDVGVRMDADYSAEATGVSLNFSSDLIPCGITCQRSLYDYSKIRANIVNYNPVIITAENNVNAHAWIIDGCFDRTITTIYYSTFYEYHEGYNYPSGCDFLTEEEVTSIYPNVYDGMTVVDSSQYNTTQYLLMNYGWDGSYDSGHYSILNYSTDWAIGLNYNKMIFYNISTSQLY